MVAALTVVGAVTLSSAGSPAAATTPGSPGTPQAPTTLYAEDFENGLGTSQVLLNAYTGAPPTNETYTADDGWLTDCNGEIVEFNTPAEDLGNCAITTDTSHTRQLAYALGVQAGVAGATNHAVTAYTEGNPGANTVEFQTVEPIALPSATGRYLSFSVDAAAQNCPPVATAPSYQFALLDGATATNVGGSIDPCATGTPQSVPAVGNQAAALINAGTYTSNGSVLFTGSSLGVRMTNGNGSGGGNDAAFDNVKILDVTPQLDKSFSPASVKTGATSALTFTITNTSELAAKNGWSFTDALPAGLTVAEPAATTTCPAGVVTGAAGASSVAVTGNLSAGMASCTATVNVTSSTPGTYTNGPDNVTETGLNPPGDTSVTFSNPELTLVKHAGSPVDVNSDGLTDAGDTIAYTFTVTNSGDVTIDNVAVTDAKVGSVTCPDATLAPGDVETCTADTTPYVITAADVTAGAVDNSATASGTPPGSTTPVTSAPSTTHTPTTAPDPELSLVKSASPSGVSSYSVGQQITYAFHLTNSGNVPLSDVSVDETAFTGAGPLSAAVCPQTDLAVGAQETCTATYTLTLLDVDAGSLSNIATATGTPPDGDGPPPVSPPSSVTIPEPEAPGVTLVKSADPATITAAGQNVTYSFLVNNTGNVTLTDVGVDETAFSGTGTAPVVTCPQPDLVPGERETCTATYVATQADVDAGSITNTATGTGTTPAGDPVASTPSSATVTATADPAITVVKSADPATATAAGTTITYSFLVTNTGNVTLTDVAVDDSDFSGTGTLGALTCPGGAATVATLAPAADATCTAAYTVTQADVDAGFITNTATATGTPPGGGTPPVSPPSTSTVTSAPNPEITVVKSVDPSSVTAAGASVTYSFLVTNTGNVTLTDVAVDDSDFSGTGTLGTLTCPGGAATVATLAPGADATCTATYTVTQADIDAGTITNTATATGTPPSGDTPPTSPPSSITITEPPAPGITVVKSADPTTVAAAGDAVTYSFLVTNTGNVTLTDVTVDDSDFSGTGTLGTVECPSASLAPGLAETCTAAYTVTQADADAGSITNTATVTGTPPDGGTPPVSPPSISTVTIPPAPGVSVVKSASPSAPDSFTGGQVITYSFVVANTGNVTLTDVAVDDSAFSGTGTLGAISCPGGGTTVASLAPGADATCTADYTLTQADIDTGKVTNTATATGTPPPGDTPPTSTPSTVTIPTPPMPAITVVKSASPGAVSKAGQQITYSFRVTNTGNVTLTDATVSDSGFTGTGKLGAITCPGGAATVTRLAPGASVTCTASYTTTQADVDSGSISNTATVTATPPGGGTPPTSPPSTATVPSRASGELTLVKTAHAVDVNGDGVTDAGDRVEWMLVVSNIGTATVTHIHISDPTAGNATCPASRLAPGQSMSCTVPSHTITAADAARGTVANAATVTGEGVDGASVSSYQAHASVKVHRTPVTVSSSSGSGLASTGEDVRLFGILAALLLGGGALLLLAGIRRRRAY